MKGKLAVIVIGALVLIVNQAHAQRRTTAHISVRHPPPISGQANRHVSRQTRQFPSSTAVYQSHSQGQQSYNPDRDPYQRWLPAWLR
jgi:hypothetical protein